MVNCQRDYDLLRQSLQAFQTPVRIGFEATSTYHRPLAYFLGPSGFDLRLISSLVVGRTRDALYNSWDKNDPNAVTTALHPDNRSVPLSYGSRASPLAIVHIDARTAIRRLVSAILDPGPQRLILVA